MLYSFYLPDLGIDPAPSSSYCVYGARAFQALENTALTALPGSCVPLPVL